MRKQLAEIREIDRYLLQEMTAPVRLVFQARMLVAPALREKVRYQRKALQLLFWLAREEKRAQLDIVFQRLMKEDHFHQSITSIFK
ncbi:hypothetical protein ACTJJ0_20850 [Chitinophaga sp. 22321]|uniref:Uncharacterized protein n=1 Tax=Chitinophaga hostae TaxID=2831022 RepID=A0ABS5J4D4_9BACT|nr:hypothetical protein [Chitinophaga hostae]MBS0029935.1 hypothetical protein [Chitinophaga hostae]